MNTKILYKASYLYLGLPLMIFLFGWLDFIWAILFGGLFLFAGYYSLRNVLDEKLAISRPMFIIVFLSAFIWCFFAGIGYFYYQSFDYHFRNAVFRDLITYDWPVFFNKAHTPMVYYMAFWLPSAVIGKLFGLFISNSNDLFIVSNVFLFLYAVIGVGLIFLQLFKALHITSVLGAFFVILGFIFFSGLDIIGTLFFSYGTPPFEFHLDWWAGMMQYSSFSTGLFWVFNQFIPISLLTLLIFNERKIQNFGLIVTISLFYSPYPTFSLGVVMLVYCLYMFIKSTYKSNFIKENIFSIQNIISSFGVLPLIILYFITNSGGIDRFVFTPNSIRLSYLLIFMGLEFLLYTIFIFSQYKSDIFFITTITLLFIIPLFRLDQQNNFCMRASIPLLVLLFVYIISFLKESITSKKRYIASFWLLLLLTMGASTGIMEFYRGLNYTLHANKINLVADDIYTLNQPYVRMPVFGYLANHQFSARDYHHDVFWTIFATRNIPYK